MKRRGVVVSIFSLFSIFLVLNTQAGQALEKVAPCVFVPKDWADGDSFQVRLPNGNLQTIRLYGADCLEWHVHDLTDSRRLAGQRRYFGIASFGGLPKTSIELAKGLGEKAALETARMLNKPFVVHTAYADARGDARYERIYAFVTTSTGEDLASHLVKNGLARAFGVYRETPDGQSGKSYQEDLRDLELLAAKQGLGAWEKTDWASLPEERRLQRSEDEELQLATGAKNRAPTEKFDLNTASRDELMKIPGVGEVTANRIISARPYKTLEDLRNVGGFGPKSLERIAQYLKPVIVN